MSDSSHKEIKKQEWPELVEGQTCEPGFGWRSVELAEAGTQQVLLLTGQCIDLKIKSPLA